MRINPRHYTGRTPGDKPFTIIAPFPPGGPVDTLARLLSAGLAQRHGQVAVVENRPGANGDIGIDLVRRATPDGHTLLVVPQGNLTIHPTLQARPHTLSYASPGVGSSLHLAGELLRQRTGADLLHVAYKGTAPGLHDVLGGTVPVIVGNIPSLLPHVQSGRLRALAVTDAARTPYLPDVPTLAQAGVSGIAISSWYGVMAPGKTPPAMLEQLEKDIREIFAAPAAIGQMDQQGLTPWIVAGAAFGALIRQETASWLPVIQAARITPQRRAPPRPIPGSAASRRSRAGSARCAG